jgi:phage tail sheath gpL-like
MGFSIPLTGLAANDFVPGNYLEVSFAQGAASLGTATYAILLVGNRSTTGTATVDTVVYGPNANSPAPLVTVQDAINLFGQGSELHRMFRRVTNVNTVTPVYAIAVTESGGAAATQAVTFATTATANGTVRTYIGDEFVDTAITSGDTAIVIAGNVASAINTKLDWAVTAANGGTAICTITAKNKGLRGNWLRGSSVINGTGVGTTSNVTAQAFFTGGTTADSNATALGTILSSRYYYIVSAAEDATQFGAVSSQVNTTAAPIVGLRQRCVAGSVDTSGNATTIATGINSARAELIWMQNADWTPADLAANAAAIYALGEASTVIKVNYDGYGNDSVTQATWKVPYPRSGTVPTRSTIKAALNNGLTPITVNPNGSTYLVARITTRSLSGANADYRIRDSHKVSICDFYGDDLLNKFSLQFSGKKIAPDPVQGQRTPGPDVATPRVVKAAVNKLTSDYGDKFLVQNPEVIQANTLVIIEQSPTTRMSCKIPLQTIDLLHQLATSLDQVA